MWCPGRQQTSLCMHEICISTITISTTQECVKIPSAYMHFCWSSSLPSSQELLNKYFLDGFILYFYYNMYAAATAAKSLQSCPTLCDPIDGSPPGSTVPGIFQARTLEWVAISFFNAWKWKVKVKSPSHVRLLETPWTAAFQAPPSMGFSRQEYWSGVPLPSPIICITYLFYIYIIPIPKKGNAKECSNYHTTIHILHTSK